MPVYQTGPILLQVHRLFCYCSYILAVQLVSLEFNLMSPSAAGSRATGSPSVFSVIKSVSTRNAAGAGDCSWRIFIAEEGDGLEVKELGDTTSQCIDTVGGLLNTSLRLQ